MNEKTKISLPWVVTVVMVPLIALSGLRMLATIDEIGTAVQEMKIQQAVTNQRLIVLERTIRNQ